MPALATLVLLLLCSSVAANDTQPHNPVFHGLNAAGITPQALVQWGLDADEITRLDELVPLEKAFSDVSRLTPFEILGKYASTEQARAAYARRYVEVSVAHQKRSLEWSVAVAAVLNSTDYRERLMSGGVGRYLSSMGYDGSVGLVDATESMDPFVTDATDRPRRIHAFVTTRDCSRCSEAFDHALERVAREEYDGVDVIFIDMAQEDQTAATDWAITHHVDAEMVQARYVTLNYDNALWQQERGERAAPLLLDSATGEPLEP